MDILPIIGRERELKQFADVLERRQPALIMVGAEAGMGKTRFLLELEAIAAALDWRVAYRDDSGELSVKPGSTSDTFSQRLRQLLELPDPERVAYGGEGTQSAKRLTTQERRSRAPVFYPQALSDVSGPEDALGLDSGSASDSDGRGRIATLPEQIRSRAPVLILIDGYEPKRRFPGWFRRALLDPLRQAPDPVVVVLADLPEIIELEASHLSPDEVIRLGPLALEDVERFLRTSCEEIQPPLTDEELHEYSLAAAEDPEVLIGLANVLPLSGLAESTPQD